MKLATNAHASGKITSLEVIRDGKVVNRLNDLGNLLLNDARASYFVFAPTRCWTHTDATANSILLNGSFEQAGTTITRVSGTGVFTSGMVGDTVKFGSGERATIVTYTSATEVQVSSAESQIVAASSLTVWGTSFSFSDATGSDIQEVTSATTIEDTVDGAGGTLTREYEFNFSASGSDYTLASVSFGASASVACYARVVLPSPVSVLTGDQLRIRYRYVKSMTNLLVPLSAQPSPITGLPFVYSLTAIVANGSYFDITTPIDHHYEAGDTITISGAIPTKSNITSITPNGSVWTVVTSTTHGLSASDSVTIEDSTVTEYNGDWTVAGVTDPNTYTITNATSPSTGSDGTSRATTPGSYFDGTYTVASVPDSTTVRVTSALTVTDAGSGSLTTPDGCSIALGRGGGTNYWVKTNAANVHPGAGSFGWSGRFIDPDNEITEPANQAAIVNLTSQGTGGAIWSNQSFASSTPTLANGFILTNQVSLNTAVVATRFNQMLFADNANSTIWYFGITYDHPQAKPDGYSLTFAVTCNYLQELA